MTDARQKLIEMITEMDTDMVDAVLKCACDLAKPRLSNSSLQFVEFSGETKGLTLVENEVCETGKTTDLDKEIVITALIRNDTNETILLVVDVNYYNKDDINVGSDIVYSPKIKPRKSWKMIREYWVNKETKKFDFDVECTRETD